MKKRGILDRLSVGFRCPMDWEAMEGEGVTKFCDQCRKTVTDLRELTEEEVESFVRDSPDGACVRLQRRADGGLVTKGCPRSAEGRIKQVHRAAAGVAAGLVLSSCATDSGEGGVIEPEGAEEAIPAQADPDAEDLQILMGVMICPEDREEI